MSISILISEHNVGKCAFLELRKCGNLSWHYHQEVVLFETRCFMGNYWGFSKELSKVSDNASLKIFRSKVIRAVHKAERSLLGWCVGDLGTISRRKSWPFTQVFPLSPFWSDLYCKWFFFSPPNNARLSVIEGNKRGTNWKYWACRVVH